MEIVFGKVNAATTFSDERIVVAEAAARLVQLSAGSAGQPDAREVGFVESLQELVEMEQNSSARGEKRVESEVDGLCAAKGRHGRW